MSRSIKMLYPILSLLGQLLVGIILGLAAIPSFLFIQWTWQQLGGPFAGIWSLVAFCLALGLSYVLFGNSLLILIVLIRNIFLRRHAETRGSLFSLAGVRQALYNLLLHVASLFYLQVMQSNFFNVWFYRGMGAKIGKGTLIATHRIWDCDLVEIGENCMIGSNSSIAAHYIAEGRGRLRNVRIGSSVTIGANTAIMPGVIIEDHVIVGAHSLVPMGMRLESGGTYLGVPAERVN